MIITQGRYGSPARDSKIWLKLFSQSSILLLQLIAIMAEETLYHPLQISTNVRFYGTCLDRLAELTLPYPGFDDDDNDDNTPCHLPPFKFS